MNTIDSYVKKTCKSCLEDVKICITCSKCDATYHIYCLNQVPGAHVNPQGQLFCCRNITSKCDGSRHILRTEDDPIEVKEEENQDGCKEDLENCLPVEENSECNKFKCDSCYLEFTNKGHLEGHYSECPYIIQGGLIQEMNRDKDLESYQLKQETSEWNIFKCDARSSENISNEHLEDHYGECSNKREGLIHKLAIKDEELENCLHKEEDLEWAEFKCDACSLELINEEHLQNHYRECPDKQRGLLQELDKDKAGLVCSFCSGEYFQEESYEQHIKRCKEHYSELNEASDVHRISMKRKQAHVHTNKQLFKCNKCDYVTKRRYLLTYHILSKHYDGKKRWTHIEYTLERHLRTRTSQKPFKCSGCDYRTALKRSLNTHMEVKHSVRTNKRPFKCDTCNYSAIYRRNLTNHILAKHSYAEKKYRCSVCKYPTREKSKLINHIRKHTNETPFNGDTCDNAATQKAALDCHILAKHSNAEKKYKCSECKYSAHKRFNLVSHMRIHTREKPFKCDICNFSTKRRSNLNSHVLTKHSNEERKYKCNDCKYSANYKSQLVHHIRIHTKEKPFKCDTCNFSTIQRGNLNSHVLTKHSNKEKKYKCSDCTYSANYKSKLVRHISTHTNEKPFKCDTCNFATTRKSQLKNHILTKHSIEEKKYKCSDCQFSTHQKWDIVRHMYIHTDEKPFKCDTCDYSSICRNSLNMHIVIKHSNVEKKYKCNDCEYSTHRKGHLTDHVLTHSTERPFKCDICDYAAIQKVSLDSHILRKHSNAEKKYKCSECKYSAHRRIDLVNHMRIHGKEKPFKCDICDYATVWMSQLKNHVLEKHSNSEKKYQCSDCKYSTHVKSRLVRHTHIHTNEKPFKCEL